MEYSIYLKQAYFDLNELYTLCLGSFLLQKLI
jgi:hypothetical protein